MVHDPIIIKPVARVYFPEENKHKTIVQIEQ